MKNNKKASISEELIDTILKNDYTKADNEKLSILELSRDLNRNKIIIDRNYQRNYLYEHKRAIPSRMIESIFLGIIIPEIQLFRDEKTRIIEVIDGQQRVLSLIDFYNNKYALTGLEELPELNGYYFKDLDGRLQAIIEDFKLNSRIVRSDINYKFQFFERLNTGTKALNAQELRRCIYKNRVLDLATKLADLDLLTSPTSKEVGFFDTK